MNALAIVKTWTDKRRWKGNRLPPTYGVRIMNNMNYRLLDFEQLSVTIAIEARLLWSRTNNKTWKKKMHSEYSIFYLVVEFNWPTFFKLQNGAESQQTMLLFIRYHAGLFGEHWKRTTELQWADFGSRFFLVWSRIGCCACMKRSWLPGPRRTLVRVHPTEN